MRGMLEGDRTLNPWICLIQLQQRGKFVTANLSKIISLIRFKSCCICSEVMLHETMRMKQRVISVYTSCHVYRANLVCWVCRLNLNSASLGHNTPAFLLKSAWFLVKGWVHNSPPHAHLTGHLSPDEENKLWDSQSDKKLLMLKEKYPV